MTTVVIQPGVYGLGGRAARKSKRKARRSARQEERKAGSSPGKRFLKILSAAATMGTSAIVTQKVSRNRGKVAIIGKAPTVATADNTGQVALNSPLAGDSPADPATIIAEEKLIGDDLNDTLRDAGITPDIDTASADAIVDLRSGEAAALDMLAQYGEAAVVKCGCLAAQSVALSGADVNGDVGQSMLMSAMQGCAPNPAAFAQMVKSAGGDLEACKPWYLRKTTLIVGGGILVAAVVMSGGSSTSR